MKKSILLTIILVSVGVLAKAQYDDKFYYPTKEVQELKWDNVEEFRFNVEEDTIFGLLLKPKNKIKASIVFYHGAGGNISTYYPMIYPLVENGYQVYMFEPRGYGYSTGIPTHLNIAHDAQIVFDSLCKRNDFIKTPILNYGACLGTQIATKMAADNSDRIDGLILDGPMSSFTDIALVSASKPMKYIIKTYVTSPYSAKEQIKEIIDMPKLIIHSTTDETIPFDQGKLVFDNAKEPKIFWDNHVAHLRGIIDKKEEYLHKIESLILQHS